MATIGGVPGGSDNFSDFLSHTANRKQDVMSFLTEPDRSEAQPATFQHSNTEGAQPQKQPRFLPELDRIILSSEMSSNIAMNKKEIILT